MGSARRAREQANGYWVGIISIRLYLWALADFSCFSAIIK